MARHVAYVVSYFPKLSETFIVDEILALERRGVSVDLFSLRRGREQLVQSASKGLLERAHFGGGPWATARALLHWVLRRPLRSSATLAVVAVEHARSPRHLVRGLGAWLFGLRFALDMERSGVRHVHAHWATHTATCAWVVTRLTGMPFSFTAHADDIFVPRPMQARKMRDASFVVTISEFARRFLSSRATPESARRIAVVHCGLDLGAFTPTPLPTGERLELACVARLEPKKGLDRLVEACGLLRDRGIDLRCRVVGEGRQREALEARIAELALAEQVELLGAQPRERVHEIVTEAHVVVLPAVVDAEGRADGIPVALIEAQALARPCVATRVSGIPELIDDERTGLLVEPGDSAGLADAIECLHRDRGLAERMGAAGRVRVEAEFDIDRSAERLAELMDAPSTRIESTRPASWLAEPHAHTGRHAS